MRSCPQLLPRGSWNTAYMLVYETCRERAKLGRPTREHHRLAQVQLRQGRRWESRLSMGLGAEWTESDKDLVRRRFNILTITIRAWVHGRAPSLRLFGREHASLARERLSPSMENRSLLRDIFHPWTRKMWWETWRKWSALEMMNSHWPMTHVGVGFISVSFVWMWRPPVSSLPHLHFVTPVYLEKIIFNIWENTIAFT